MIGTAAPPPPLHLALDAEQLAEVRRLADDARVWAVRLAHDNGGRTDVVSALIAREAAHRAIILASIVRACDAARMPQREAA